jgi:hypothetical protein
MLIMLVFWLASFPIAHTAHGSSPLVRFDTELTNYYQSQSSDPVACLQKRIETGKLRLTPEGECGYLLPLLKELDVPVASQLLVFSKTSLQRHHISSKTPRAIFFNDRVYVAWIPGAPMIELLGWDPKLGAVLYSFEQTKKPLPHPVRDNRCLECHITSRTLDIPGQVMRSFVTSKEGQIDLLSGDPLIQRAPAAERWGGWYVTGEFNKLSEADLPIHRGDYLSNGMGLAAKGPAKTNGSYAPVDFDISAYPQRTSDIVALMVLEHQTRMANLLTRMNYEATAVFREQGHVSDLNKLTDTFLRSLLFIDGPALDRPVQGSESFLKWFEAQGPKDKQGRSLRQFDLRTRLFKYPCSYLIYSEAFDQLPSELKKHLYRRLFAVLTGEDSRAEFQAIPAEARQAILGILAESKMGLPVYWTL